MKRLLLLGLIVFGWATAQAQQRTRSPHGELRLECKACHRPNGWTQVRVTKAFDHGRSGFPLSGAHQTASCRACHASLDFKGVKHDCTACHKDIHRGELGADCSRCHTARSFLDREAMTKAHQLTRFPLQGGHLAVDCASCHKPGAQGRLQFVATESQCVSCHQENYAAAANHVAQRFPTTCEDCHTQVTWNRVGRMGAGHPTTPIALTGVHSSSQCTDCHASLPYASVKQTCDGCHHADYVNTINPKHPDAGFAVTCTDCHALVPGWTGATYTHASAPIPVNAAHATVGCTDCHTTAPYSTVKQTCDGCHHTEYVGTTNPNHAGAGYSTDCASCHQIVANWAGAAVNHPTAPLALTGVHANRQCTDCHATGQPYPAVRQTCDGCHHTDYVAAKNPDHLAAPFALTCTDCHGMVAGWAGATYAHASVPVALTGGHAPALVTCTQCHTSAPYSTVTRTCDGCHHPDYQLANDPPHQAAGFAVTCENCHTQTVWATSTFVHPATPIAVSGAHTGVGCAACHTTTPYSTVKTTCDGCHHADYVATANPNHTAAGYSTDCASCHQVVTNWAGAAINHPTTPIALTGVHSSNLVACSQCHTTMPYTTVKQTCDGCHHADYAAAKDPDHVAAGFSVSCTDCHGLVAGWTGASYANHSTTPINPKQGAHAAVTCAQCHKTSPYSSAPTTCDGCHHADYVATTNPSHSAAGFAVTCLDCHQIVAGWTGATFPNHPSSPLALTGPHAMTVRQCTDCHTSAAYASVATTCDGCHHATYVAVTDPNHQATGMSAFAAANCSTCHSPTKSVWTSPTWTHMTIVNPQRVRLPHEGASCADCHQVSSDYTVKSCAKSGCHRNVNGP
jgi:hypothetical protein